MSWHQNDQPLWIYMWRHQVLLTLSSCADPVIKGISWQTVLQEWHTEDEQIISDPCEILCQMPFMAQPSQLTQTWDRHQSILVIYTSGLWHMMWKIKNKWNGEMDYFVISDVSGHAAEIGLHVCTGKNYTWRILVIRIHSWLHCRELRIASVQHRRGWRSAMQWMYSGSAVKSRRQSAACLPLFIISALQQQLKVLHHFTKHTSSSLFS